MRNPVPRFPHFMPPWNTIRTFSSSRKGNKKDLYIFSLRNVGIHLCSLLRCNKTGHFARECPEGEADEREVFRVDDDDDDAGGDDDDDFVSDERCDRRT